MKIADFDLKAMLDFQPSSGRLLLGGDRMLLFRQDAFASLRKLLFEQLGEELARALLMQFGYRCGHGDHHALTTRFSWDSELDEMSAGPVMHTWEGIVHVEPTLLDFDKALGRFHMRGIWRNSYEAEVHRQEFGASTRPVCHSLTGYASGWCTAFFGSPLLAIETMCAGQGDPHCQFEIRRPEAWGSEAEMWRTSLVATDYSISRELADKLATIDRQREAISRLSSPIIQVWEGVLTVPIVGEVDPERAAHLLEDLLDAVLRTRARYAILDLTGVDVVDTSAVHHFFKVVGAVELAGRTVHHDGHQASCRPGDDLPRHRHVSRGDEGHPRRRVAELSARARVLGDTRRGAHPLRSTRGTQSRRASTAIRTPPPGPALAARSFAFSGFCETSRSVKRRSSVARTNFIS